MKATIETLTNGNILVSMSGFVSRQDLNKFGGWLHGVVINPKTNRVAGILNREEYTQGQIAFLRKAAKDYCKAKKLI
ncbi:MAG TPA: hypothetical protein PLP33_24730 [Leptospiraceae bacterium]|nr:hypothetical protein [Leptospiraceae bacterium]